MSRIRIPASIIVLCNSRKTAREDQNPLYDELKAIKNAVKNTPESEVGKTVGRIDLRNIQKEIRFFYPFEVQIYDEASNAENLAGLSSHSNYKKSQIQAAMRRVMGELLRFSDAQS